MSERTWGRIRLKDFEWQPVRDTVGQAVAGLRRLESAGGRVLIEIAIHGNAACVIGSVPSDVLMLVMAGGVVVRGEPSLRGGHLRWMRAGHPPLRMTAGPGGAHLLMLAVGGNDEEPFAVNAESGSAGAVSMGAMYDRSSRAVPATKRVHVDDVEFLEFPDAAGRDTQPVQLLFSDDPYVLRTRFAPTFMAGEHWHEYDTIYVITAGSMRFGPQEPNYEAGDIRWVRGGHSYGPEHPGCDGVEFYLISLGGPVSLHWADLEPAPRGSLTG